jgi:EAL and modified HD-GYP domain-containing signal transduction protein
VDRAGTALARQALDPRWLPRNEVAFEITEREFAVNTHAVLVARQPIYDAHVNVVGYEVLYRSTDANFATFKNGDAATANVSVHALLDIGLDTLVGQLPAYINCTRNFLVERIYEFLPAERVVLEVLEDIAPDEAVFAALTRARAQGYRIALDDFVLNERNAAFVAHADVLKIDLPRLSGDAIEQHVKRLARPGLQVLAEKVETHEMFERCKKAGYGLFQGYFFARPQLMRGRRAPGDRFLLLRILARVQDPNVDLDEIEHLVSTNLSVSYKLLRYVNSAVVGAAEEIESIRHAIAMLGLERVRICVVMLVLAGFDDKPHELILTALVRGRYCELLAVAQKRERVHSYFTVGLLSVLDAFMDRPMDELVKELSISPELEAALLRREGPMGATLDAAIACERADWPRVVASGIDVDALRMSYLQALSWAGQTGNALSAAGKSH